MNNKKPLLLTGIIQFFATCGFFFPVFFISEYAKNLGASNLEISLLISGFSFASFISSMFSGKVADKIGEKKILFFGFLIASAGFLFLFYSFNYPSLFVFRFISGFGIGIFQGALASYAFEFGMSMGKYASYGAMGAATGQFLSGFFVEKLGMKSIFLAPFFLMFSSFSLVFLFPPLKAREIDIPGFPTQIIKKNKDIYLTIFLRHSGATAVWAFWNLFLKTLNTPDYLRGILNMFIFIGQASFMFYFVDRMESDKAIKTGLVLTIISFFAFTVTFNYYLLIPFMFLVGAAWALLYAGSLKKIMEENVERATASSLLSSSISLSSIIGPILGGIILSILPDYRWIMVFALLLAIITLLIFQKKPKVQSK